MVSGVSVCDSKNYLAGWEERDFKNIKSLPATAVSIVLLALTL